MGFDCVGVCPKEEKGEYFRNNCWYWRPLWEYVVNTCSDILDGTDAEQGAWNNGYQITEKKALLIANRLKELSDRGDLDVYAYERGQEILSMPDEECNLCNGTGARNDKFVQGECNKCRGKGKVRPRLRDYPFDKQNVLEFAEFCRLSGGFEIC